MKNTFPDHKAIKEYTIDQLEELAKALRAELVETVLRQGGHLSSNLGVVELTLALSYVFDPAEDKLVFDVGHQSYVYKLLTGRRAAFAHLRERGGMAGFPRREESECDCFVGGHASTALSAALGMARARDLRGEDHSVVAIVGDGALTGGMCYEALNDAGHTRTPLIVILNDNEMSISRNVGALEEHLTNLRQSAVYTRAKRAVKSRAVKVPFVYRVLHRIKHSLKRVLVRDSFFDALGFEYLGPIDGHDIAAMVRIFSRARESGMPVLLHVLTQKGCGWSPAEEKPDNYHGVSPRGETGGLRAGQIAADTLVEMARKEKSITALTAAMPSGTGSQRFKEAFPDRFFDVGIAEEHMVTMAAGMACGGLKPYVFVYSTFLQRAYDQLINDVCLQSLPVTLLIDRAGLVGPDGATHHGVFDLSYLRQMPGMTICAPRSDAMLRALLACSANMPGPMAIRYGRQIAAEESVLLPEIGKWQKLREGKDVSLIAVGAMVQEALAAACLLEQKGVSCEVIDAVFVKPLDAEMLEDTARRVSLVAVIEENVSAGGLGGAVLEELSARDIQARTALFGVPDRFVEQGRREEQLVECGLTGRQLSEKITAMLNV